MSYRPENHLIFFFYKAINRFSIVKNIKFDILLIKFISFLIIFSLCYIDASCSNTTISETTTQKSPPIKIKLSKSLFENGAKLKIYDENYFENRKNTNNASESEEIPALETRRSLLAPKITRTSRLLQDNVDDSDTRPYLATVTRKFNNNIQKNTLRTNIQSDNELDISDTRSYSPRISARRSGNTPRTNRQLKSNDNNDFLVRSYIYFANGLRQPEELGKNPKLSEVLTWMSDNINYIYLYPQDEMNSKKIKVNISRNKNDSTISYSADIFSILNDNEIQNIIRRTKRTINTAFQHIKSKDEYDEVNEIEYYCHLMQVTTDAMKAYAELRTILNLKFIAVSTISIPNVDETLLHIIYMKIFSTILTKIETATDVQKVINLIRE